MCIRDSDYWARWRGGMTVASEELPAVEWRNVAGYVVAALAAWASSEAGWFIPPVVGILVAVVAVLALQRGRHPVTGRDEAPVGTR